MTTKISHHAADRFYQRIFDKPDDEKPNKTQREHISKLIIEALMDEHPEAEILRSGIYKIRAYEVNFTMQCGIVTTVLFDKDEHQGRDGRGGIIRSGKKIKKKNKQSAYKLREAKSIEMEERKKRLARD